MLSEYVIKNSGQAYPVRLLLTRAADNCRLPFEFNSPNADTQRAIESYACNSEINSGRLSSNWINFNAAPLGLRTPCSHDLSVFTEIPIC